MASVATFATFLGKMVLFSLGNFYGEVFYDAHTNKILRLKAFDTTGQLVPYLAHIKFNLH